MQELPALLAAVVAASEDYRAARSSAAEARARLAAALAAAHAGGASYSMLGRLVGMSRQAVAEVIDSAR